MDIGAIIIGVIGAGILFKILDLCSKLILDFVFSKDYFILNLLKKIDDKYIDTLKVKSPLFAKELELRLVVMLDKAKLIILDKSNN